MVLSHFGIYGFNGNFKPCNNIIPYNIGNKKGRLYMVYDYLLTGSLILIVLLLAICAALYRLYRKSIISEKLCSEQLRSNIESSNRKTDFFSNMAHELKTPLSVILGAVQLMEIKGKDLRENEQNAAGSSLNNSIRIIKYNSLRMLRLTNNLLDLTRAEAGYQLLKPVNCDLDLLFEEIVQSVKPYAEKNELELQYIKPRNAITLAVDIEKMERIMLNLLSNAIKFTKPGGKVTVSLYECGNRAFVSVKDSGIGIPAELQEDIFKRYKQSGRSPAAESDGSGIGLSLVRSFVMLHQGNIKINSENGQGTEFIIDLPIRLLDQDTQIRPAGEIDGNITEAVKLEFSALHSVST